MGKSALIVLPMSQTMELVAGETREGTVTVAAPDDVEGETKYSLSVTPYSVVDEEYTADLATENNRSMIVNWIKLSETSGTIKAGEKKEISFTVKTPKDAPAGGQYAVVAVSLDNTAKAEGNKAKVANTPGLGSIIFATVDGETVREGEILENNIPSFANTVPVEISSKIKNDGNIHEAAKYMITVTDVFTGRVILPNDNDSGGYTEMVMPETIYSSAREIEDLPLIGMVKITQNIEYLDQQSYVEQVVVICPVWFMILAFLTVAAFVAVVVTIVKRYRRKKIVL